MGVGRGAGCGCGAGRGRRTNGCGRVLAGEESQARVCATWGGRRTDMRAKNRGGGVVGGGGLCFLCHSPKRADACATNLRPLVRGRSIEFALLQESVEGVTCRLGGGTVS